jgi:mono/diheme cytochrome c family protein
LDVRAVRLALAAVLLGLLPLPAPAQAPEEKVQRGRDIYNTHCFICHGHELRGSPGSAVYPLYRFPKDQRDRFMNSVTNGKAPGMPSWKGELSPEEMELLWAFVLSGGDPDLPAIGGH